ncbi:hypothetical protein [Streptomyces xiamenensis]|uniref:AbiJ-related protein n=1 Tax=Streptomyces xiamenensis TaxID=408015 RepID=UPI003D7431B0
MSADKGIDLRQLRQALDGIFLRFHKSYTATSLPKAFAAVGLPEVPDEGTKAKWVGAAYAALPEDQLPDVAARILLHHEVTATQRNEVQDLLWAQRPVRVEARVRREMAREIDLTDLVRQGDRFMGLLQELWPLDSGEPILDFSRGTVSYEVVEQIKQHVFRNDDWSTAELFEFLGVFDAGHARFAAFLEGMLDPTVLPDEPAQRKLVEVFQRHLRSTSVEMCEVGTEDGYPVFKVVPSAGARGRELRNLIFGSAKPDLRLIELIDGDAPQTMNRDEVIVYDRPIADDGLRWCDLQDWWQETKGLKDSSEAKDTLYKRMLSFLPPKEESPPQWWLFTAYHRLHGPTQMPQRPALLPEVWRHWDPKTMKARGGEALSGLRMDFLLLLPHGRRVVIEVDGAHHYSTDGRPDTDKYARQAAEDRKLKLRGYDVYRFGGKELSTKETALQVMRQFLTDLWHHYDLPALPDD